MTDSIYAYRGENNSFSLTLLRASQSPDMYPEYGMHSYNIGIGICDKDEYFRYSDTFNYPLYFITNTSHKGSLPLKNSFISTSKNIAVSTLKTSEDENGFIVRVFDISKNGGMAFIQINADFEVTAVDNLERPIDKEVSRDGSRVLVNLSPCETIALKVTLNKGVV
jgi:alpha-mannosidase